MRSGTWKRLGVLAPVLVAQLSTAWAEGNTAPASGRETRSFAEITSGLQAVSGLLTVHLDRSGGRVWLELPADIRERPIELIYVAGLRSGLGSNPVGLDRGQLGGERFVQLRVVGGRLLIEQQNLAFRALSDNPLEVRAVRDSFATSVLWSGPLAARADDGRAVVDLTSFLVRDAHRVATTLQRSGQGKFVLDPDRSTIDPEACLAFPDNNEFEALLTFAFVSSESAESLVPGPHVQETTPTPEAISLVLHHSFIRPPAPGYVPRAFDPRAASFAIAFADYAAGLDEPLVKRWIVRHRLEKTDPAAPSSPVKEPIVYYVDAGAPEPIRQALIDGAGWWAAAFEAAGFENAFRVEQLPENAHPLDVRYNVIQWVHRSTRGWSYGGGVTDPRTGEMIKGHVSLGSLRVRQDRLIFEGLAGTSKTGTGAADDPVELALARIRQLSAHEVGHTLGLSHNFAASTYGRASVMDYPAPLVTLGPDGSLDFSQAYGVGVGEWDVHSIRFAYSQFPSGANETAELERLVRDAGTRGLLFLTDADARPDGAAHPKAHLWDNGTDPVAELERLQAVRGVALEGFGQDRLLAGRPLALLHETLVPVYLLHRFQIRAAVKVLGGVDYGYAVRGDENVEAERLDPEWQRRALDVLLDQIEPHALDLPETVLELLLPRPFGHSPHRELFDSATSPTFDALGAAATLTRMVSELVLQPERLARLVDNHRRDASQPSLEEVLSTIVQRVFFDTSAGSERHAELERVVQGVVLDRLLELARSAAMPPRVRHRLDAALEALESELRARDPRTPAEAAFSAGLEATIRRHRMRSETAEPLGAAAATAPPGQPIGSGIWAFGESQGCSWEAWPAAGRSEP